MAHGRATLSSFYTDLEKRLQQQLSHNPRLHGARLKLMELYFDAGRKDDFLTQARRLATSRDQLSTGDWSQVAHMARLLGVSDTLARAPADVIEFAQPAPAGAASAGEARRFAEDPAYRPYFERLAHQYAGLRTDAQFLAELDMEATLQLSRPSALYPARRLGAELRGARIFLKREDQSPAGTRLSISLLGQALMARRLGLSTVVTATGNGQRGIATAAIAARLGLQAVVFMERQALERHAAQVARMRLMGARVEPAATVEGDIRNAALQHCVRHANKAMLLLGLDAAPAPFPLMNREFSSIIGRECRRQVMAQARRLPDLLVARGAGAADAIGFFDMFLRDAGTRLVCVEGGADLGEPAEIEPTLASRRRLSADERRVADTILEGSDYPGVAREHAFLQASGRVEYLGASTSAAKRAIAELARCEGLVPAIESAHAIGWACAEAQRLGPEQVVVVMLAEHAEKDIWEITRALAPQALH